MPKNARKSSGSNASSRRPKASRFRTSHRTRPAAASTHLPSHHLPAARVQKPRHPWITVSLWTATLLLVIAGMWLVSSSGMVANRFKPQLELELSRALNREVTIGRLEGGVFDRVVLRHVNLATPHQPGSLAIEIDRVVVQYSLWDILVRKRPLAQSLHHIQLIHPLIHFERDAAGSWHGPALMGRLGSSQVAGSTAAPPTLPPIKISLLKGEVRLNYGEHVARIRNLRGLVNLKDPRAVRIFFSGSTEAGKARKNLRISGVADLAQRSFRLGVDAARVHLQPWQQVALSSEYIRILSGQADLQLQFTSRSPGPQDLIPGVSTQGKLVLYDLAVATPLLPQPLRSIFGVVHLRDRELTLKSMQAVLDKSRWDAQGRISDLSHPWLNIKVKSNDIALGDLMSFLPSLDHVQTQGTGKATILIKGSVPDLTITGNLVMPKGSIGGLDIRKFEVITHYRQKRLQLLMARGSVARGWIEGKGQLIFSDQDDQAPTVNFQGLAKDLVLADLGKVIGMKTIRGHLNGNLQIRGDINQPTLLANLDSSLIQIGDIRFAHAQGNLQWNPRLLAFSLQGDWGTLNNVRLGAQVVRRDQSWFFPAITLTQGKTELLNASGNLSTRPEQTLAGRIQIRSMPLLALPFIPKSWRHLNGLLSFNGRVLGTLAQPQLEGRFYSPALVTKPRSALNVEGHLILTKAGLELKSVVLDQNRIHLEGFLGMKSPQALKGELKFHNAPLLNLVMLGGLKPPSNASGRVRGQVTLGGSLTELQCRGRLNFKELRWQVVSATSASLNFTSTGKRIWIKEMELVQPGGKFNAVVEAELGKTSAPLQVLVWMENFQIGKRHWTADLKIKGARQEQTAEAKYAAQVRLDNFEINGRKLPGMTGQLALEKNRLHLQALNWGKEYQLQAELLWGKTWQGRLQLNLTQSRLDHLFTLLGRERARVDAPLDGHVTLAWEKQNYFGEVQISSGSQSLQGQGSVRVSAAGKTVENYDAQVQLTDMQLPFLLNILQRTEPERAPQGKVTGKVSFSGNGAEVKRFALDTVWNDIEYGQWHFKRLVTAAEKDGDVLRLRKLEGTQAVGSLKALTGSARRQEDKSWALQLELVTDDFIFFSRKFYGRFNVGGRLQLTPEFDLRLKVASPDFRLNLYPYNNFQAELHYRGDRMSIRTPPGLPYRIVGDLVLPSDGSVEFQRLTISDAQRDTILVNGRVAGGESDLWVKVRDVKADIIARSLGWPQPWTGIASGTIHYTDPNHITRLEITVKVENGSVLHLPFDIFSGNILIDHDWLYFKGPQGACTLQRQGKYTLLLSGKLPLPQSAAAEAALRGAEMDVTVSMSEGDLSFLTFIPDIAAAAGKTALELNLRGTMEYPSLNGRATITRGVVSPRLYFPQIEDVQADLKWEDNEMIINQLHGKIGEGRLRISAGPEARWACVFRQLQPYQLNLHLQTPKGRIHMDTTPDYEFVSAGLLMDAFLAGTYEAPQFGGVLDVADGQFTYPARILSETMRQRKGASITFNNLKLICKKNIWFYNDFIRAQLAPEQSVAFNGGQYDLWGEGRINVSKGSFTYLETDFDLDPNEETALIFQGRQKPRLNAFAKTVIRNVRIKDEGRGRDATIYLKVDGELGALKIHLSSDPDMSQAQIMSLLTLGEDFSSWSQEEIDQKIQAAGARVLGRMASNLIGREIEKSIKKITPLDVIDIRLGGVEKLADTIMTGSGNTVAASTSSSEVTGTSLLQDTEIDVGKYLTDELFLNYRGVLKERTDDQGSLAWQSYLGLEYNIDPSKKIKVYKNFDADSDQEMFWGIESRTEFKGWQPEEGRPVSTTPTTRPKSILTPIKNP